MQAKATPDLQSGVDPALLPAAGLPAARSETHPSNTMAELKAHIDAATRPKQIEVTLPKVGIVPLIAEWGHPNVEPRRHSCPIKSTPDLDFSSFSKYLKDVGLEATSIAYNIQNIKRFFNLLKVGEGQFELQ